MPENKIVVMKRSGMSNGKLQNCATADAAYAVCVFNSICSAAFNLHLITSTSTSRTIQAAASVVASEVSGL